MKPILKIMMDDAMLFTEKVTKRWDDRLVGSKACLECGTYLMESLNRFCDSTRMHKFTVRPGGFLGFIDFVVVLYFFTLLSLWAQFLGLAVIFAIISICISFFQQFLYKDFISFLYPKKNGQNIIGFIEPSGEVKQQIIISSHHDSAHIFNFIEKDPKSYVQKTLIANASAFSIAIASTVLWLIQLLNYQLTTLIYVVAAIFTILSYYIVPLWFFYSKKGTPGAGDNMVCTAIAMEVGKHFASEKKEGKGLKHTRIVVASWDGEEAGLRGSRAYVKEHLSELKKVKTYNFNLECMYNYKELGYLTSDLNSFVSLSEGMVDECISLSKTIGYSIKKVPMPFLAGATDAAEFAKAGIEATTLVGMHGVGKDAETAYHTSRDTIEAVDAKAVYTSIELGIQYILEKENQIEMEI